jgi:hypothetical protein
MKKTYVFKITLVGLMCAGAALLSGDAFAAGKAGDAAGKAGSGDAQITVGRSPKLGSGTISVSIDGKRIESVGSGRFSSSVPPGKHTLTVAFDPSRAGDKPTSLEINAVAGQTYGFLATIQHGDIVLTKNK